MKDNFEYVTLVLSADVSVVVNSLKGKVIPETIEQGLKIGWQLAEHRQVIVLENHPSLLETSVACFRQGSNLDLRKM